MHKLLARQLRAAAHGSGTDVDVDALIAIVDQTYHEFDRDRRLNERAATLMEEELRAANTQSRRDHDVVLSAIMNNASDGMLVVSQDGIVETANSAAEIQFGAVRAGLDGIDIRKLLGPGAQALARGDAAIAMERSREGTGFRLDGGAFPVEFSFNAVETSSYRRQLWIVRDISDRVRSQREILESRLRFQDFAESSSDCFWELDQTLSRVSVSSALESELSQLLTVLLTPGPSGRAPEGVNEEMWTNLRRNLMARQHFRTLRVDLPREDGRVLHVSIGGKPVFDLDGRFRGYRGTARDVTREVSARDAARRAERRLIEAMDAAPSAIALVDAQLNLVGGNSALKVVAPDDARFPTAGHSFANFLMRALQGNLIDDNATPATLLKALAASGEMREIEIGGAWYLAAARSLSDGGAVLTFTDVNILKQRERELAEAKLAAESASRLKSQFLATMSHELRTPLNAILGFSEVIRDGVFGQDKTIWGKYGEYAGSIHASGRHLLSLISEILDLSKIEAGSYVLSVDPVDFRDVLQSAVTIISPAAKKANVTVQCTVPDEPVRLTADDRALRQITLNLMANAVKFTPAGGQVTLKLSVRENWVEFTVHDTGIGIPQEHLSAVFEPFRQVDASIRRRHEGTGLGLAITKRLVEMHGGSIGLTSEVGVGTEIRVMLPCAAITEDQGQVQAEAAA